MNAEEVIALGTQSCKVIAAIANLITTKDLMQEGSVCIYGCDMYSPAQRGLPFASEVWELNDPELWDVFVDEVDDFIDNKYTHPSGQTLHWEDGNLFLGESDSLILPESISKDYVTWVLQFSYPCDCGNLCPAWN